ncbi:MAG: AI-2E family transporter, partial [Methylobacter sp.]|nr:AI-2E family transporter [Methylobacter sp.]
MNNFSSSTQIRQFIPGILLVGLLLLGFMVLREFLLTLTWALIIAYVVWPPYQYLKYRLKINATLSAALMTTIIAAAIFLIVYWLAAMLQDELKTAYQTLVSGFNQDTYRLPDFIKRIPWLGNTAQQWLDRVIDDRAGVIVQFTDWAKQWSGEFAQFLGGIGH